MQAMGHIDYMEKKKSVSRHLSGQPHGMHLWSLLNYVLVSNEVGQDGVILSSVD